MNSPHDQQWLDANFTYMMTAIAYVRRDVMALIARVQGGPAPEETRTAEEELVSMRARMSRPPAVERLVATFGLSEFERYVLLMCAAVESDPTFASLCAVAQGGDQFFHPSLNLALGAYSGAVNWTSFLPTAPLRYWGFVEIGQGETLNTSPLRIDERTLHHLAGASYLDVRLRGFIRTASTELRLPASHTRVAERIGAMWSRSAEEVERPLVQLTGSEFAASLAVAGAACRDLGLELHTIRAADIPTSAVEREHLLRLWNREARLSGGALLIDCGDADTNQMLRGVAPFLDGIASAVIIAGHDPVSGMHRPVVRLDLHKPTSGEQRELWASALGEASGTFNGQVDSIVTHFNLGLNGLRAASAQAIERVGVGESSSGALWDACRAQARPRLENLAQRIVPAATWDDLVLPEHQLKVLREIAAHMRHRATVYERWGFASKSGRGLGISAMFAGPSGTGKTMAAEVLAGELMLDLYHIDLSQVVSKYIGETEKNLARVFDAAEEGGAILLFDEADALFGKRSDVKDSHDRYANVEVSYLLQRMESYRGLAILTTNMKQALDAAFLRRLRFVVQFPFPDAEQRSEIWKRAFPLSTPTEGIDIEKLGRLSVAGGNIRNIALNAAFMAAGEGAPVRMTHLLTAARSEYEKLEKSLTDHEVREWI